MACGMEDHLPKAVVALLLGTASAIGILHLLLKLRLKKAAACPANLPPGSMGVPVIGQTLGLLRAVRTRTLDRWLRDRIQRYGPASKLSVLCTPTVLLTGPAGNKLVFFSRLLRVAPPRSFRLIFGERSILDLHGDDHQRVRGALMEFLKPDMLKQYVGRVDAKVRQHLEERWRGRAAVTVLPLMRQLSLDVISSLLFGLETRAVQEELADDLVRMRDGVFAIPLNLPFTAFGRSLEASRRARRRVDGIIRHKKARLGLEDSSSSDLIARLLSLTDHHGQQLLTHEEIVDNVMFALVAGHDTTSILMTCMLRHLADNPAILAAMLQEHEEIARNKTDAGEALTWEDLSKMKFTWQVVQETLRVDPPIFGNFRTALQDMELGTYCIPKGWKVLWTATATHMDPSIFHEPAKFDPSRFASHRSAVPPCSFVAFGGGHKICPGIEFVKIEALVTMHNLVRHFRWKLSGKDNTYTQILLHGLPIQLLEHNNTPTTII